MKTRDVRVGHTSTLSTQTATSGGRAGTKNRQGNSTLLMSRQPELLRKPRFWWEGSSSQQLSAQFCVTTSTDEVKSRSMCLLTEQMHSAMESLQYGDWLKEDEWWQLFWGKFCHKTIGEVKIPSNYFTTSLQKRGYSNYHWSKKHTEGKWKKAPRTRLLMAVHL